jgi:nucleotide-binding universal stress UspA family protein
MQHPTGPGRRRRLLVPVRLEAVGEGKLRVVAEQAHALSAEVVLLHVLTRAELDPANVRPTEARARTYLETVAAHLEELGVPAATVVRSGPPATTIVAEATAIDAVLIVLGASSHRWLSRVMLGSMADEVVHTAPCPVLLVRPERHGCAERHGVRSFTEDAARPARSAADAWGADESRWRASSAASTTPASSAPTSGGVARCDPVASRTSTSSAS